jgi:hypothetical protein
MKLARLLGAAVAAYFIVSANFLPHFAVADKAIGDPYILEDIDPFDSPVKPTLSLSRLELTLEEAEAEPVRTIDMTIKGANNKYAPTAIHINYDERLSLVMDGDFFAERGKAIAKLDDVQFESGPHSFCLVTAGSSDCGKDGVMWSFTFRLPDDVKEGDVFPVCIEYQQKELTNDLFTNINNDRTGQLMEAWIFTNGIQHGYIKIKEPVTTTADKVTTTTSTTTTTMTSTTTSTTTTTAATTTVTTTQPITTAPQSLYMLGDPTGNGIIDAVDSSYVLGAYARFSIGGDAPDEKCLATCDVTGDGLVDAVDASKILSYYAYTSSSRDPKSFMEFLAG